MICTTNRLYKYFLLLFALLILARKSESAFETSESKLHSKLFKLYNRFSYPSKQSNSTVKVEFDYQLINILDVSARNQYIKTYAWVNQYWTNELLTWDPAEYDGIDQIHVDPRDIWVPDVLLYNNIDEEDRFGGGPHTYKANVALQYNGQCTWLNPAIFKSICSVDVTYFPFDDQECKLKFGSWSFDLSKVDMHPDNKSAMNKNYIKNGEWDLRKIEARRNQKHYKCCKYDFVDVTITINISRVSLDYIMKLIIPCSLISSMIFLGFVLPPESGERIGLSITVLLAMTVFQQLTSELMPSYGFPLLGQYYFATMMEIGASLAITTFILNFYHRSSRRMPAFLRVVILKWITRVAFPFRKNKTIEIDSRCTNDNDHEEDDCFMETDMDNCDHMKNKQNRWINGGDFPEGYELSCSTCESTDNMYNNSSGRKNHASTRRGIDKSRVRKYKPKHVINNEHCPDSIRQSRPSYFTSVPFGILNSDSEISAEKERNKKEWMKAARVLDRVFLIVSVIIGTLTLFAIFLKAPRFRLN